LFQRFFGAHTYRVIRKTNCPVLIVPENIDYRSIGKIVFAWNYRKGEKLSFASLLDLTKPFNARYTLLHVSTHRPEITKEVFTAFRHEAEDYFGDQAELQFEQVFATNVPRSIDDYMKRSEGDLLAITYLNRKILRAFFHGQITKKFIDHVTYPILVLHA
jgi:nucleotide-binding universal stress UspA family protein